MTPVASAKEGSGSKEVEFTRQGHLSEIHLEAGAGGVPKVVFQLLQSRPMADGLVSKCHKGQKQILEFHIKVLYLSKLKMLELVLQLVVPGWLS